MGRIVRPRSFSFTTEFLKPAPYFCHAGLFSCQKYHWRFHWCSTRWSGCGRLKIAWSLWVTKLAPDGMEARYMGAHVALTGLRGALAPFLGYWLLGILGYEGVAWFSVALVTFSTFLFYRLFSNQRAKLSGL